MGENTGKTKKELIKELQELKQENNSLKALYGKGITESTRAENLLQQNCQNYETFFNAIDEFLFVLDEQGNIIHTNSTVIDRLGYTSEELSGQSVLMVHPPERRDEAGRIVVEMLSGVTEFCPVPVITKSGIQIPVETRVTLGKWDDKPAIFGVTKDISKIRLSEEKFSKLFFINPSACGLSDLDDHTYTEVNEAFYTLFGFDRNEVIGKTAYDLGIFTHEAANAILLKADSNGSVTDVEAELRAKNGDIKHVRVSAENIYVQDKKYRYTVVNDITESKRAEKALRESSQKFEAIVSASPDGIGMASLDGKLQLISDKLLAMYGYSIEEKDELLGTAFFDFIDPSNHNKLIDNINKLMAGKKDNKVTEYLALRKDNSRFYVDINSTVLLDSNGNYESILFVERDITERKQIDEEIKLKNIELQRINAEIEKFFSIIAHDLRGPFNVFLGLTEIMAVDLPNLTMNQIQGFAVNISKSATSLYRLLNNLLDWTQIKKGSFPFSPVKIQLHSLVNESIILVKESAKIKEIEIVSYIPNGLEVFADTNMLQTVIRNLISNAVKFTSRGGKVSLSAKANNDDCIEISIKDTGIGMSQALIDSLFRIDIQSTRKGTEGELSTGLGLLLCKEFIEKHDGKIWVESKEGVGSTLNFSLPKPLDAKAGSVDHI